MNTNRRRSIHRAPTLSAATLASALILAACGGGPAATGPGGPAATAGGPAATTSAGGPSTQAPGGVAVDVCALLPDADIEAVTGNRVRAMTPGAQVGMLETGCGWQLIDDDSIVPPEIVLGVVAPGGRDHYTKYFEPFNEGAGYEAIPNLGDIAVDADFGSVMVVAGDAFFNLQYIGSGGDSTTVIELARKVVANLSK